MSPPSAAACADSSPSPLVAVLEDRGVQKSAFLDLQNIAKASVVTAGDQMERAIQLLRKHDLGNVFGLRFLLARLARLQAGAQDLTALKKKVSDARDQCRTVSPWVAKKMDCCVCGG